MNLAEISGNLAPIAFGIATIGPAMAFGYVAARHIGSANASTNVNTNTTTDSTLDTYRR